MTLENKLSLKEVLPTIIFWLKPNGQDYCKSLLSVDNGINKHYCLKVNDKHNNLRLIDCKYLKIDWDNLDLSYCTLKKKNERK